MIEYEVQPWGTPPTPLLPRALLTELGHLAMPQVLHGTFGPGATLSSLNGPEWERLERISEDSVREVVKLVRGELHSLKHISIRSEQPLHRPVEYLPFSTRTRNAVYKHLSLFSSKRLTFGDILSVPAFGARSALEFACVIEASISLESREKPASFVSDQAHTTLLPREIKSMFQALAAYAAGELNLETLGPALPPAPVAWPPEIRQLWTRLGQLDVRKLAGELAKQYSVAELITRALAPLEPRLREILAERVLVAGPATTLEVLGDRLGVTRERVRQLEKMVFSHIEGFQRPEFRPVIRRSNALSERLGVGIPSDSTAVDEALTALSSDLEEPLARELLLWLAGPYKERQGWLLAKRHLPKLTLDALLNCQDERGLICESAVSETLTRFGFHVQYHGEWMARLDVFERVENGFIYFKGGILEKARALLRYYDRPLTVEEMLERIDSESVRSVRQRLIDDPGFWRINKQSQFVIAGTPNYDEYTGITDEIVQELDACGGQASFDHLVEKISRVYGVKESSVIAYLSTPMFTKDDSGTVRVRDGSQGIEVTTNIGKTAACYMATDGTWYWRVCVDDNLVRGSGRLVPNAFAQLLGCALGEKIEIDSECGPITVSWPLASTTGASIGSLRPAIANCNAQPGDYLFVKATKPLMTFECLRAETLSNAENSVFRLSLLLGCLASENDVDAIRHISRALGVDLPSVDDNRSAARRILQSRGETELANLIAETSLSVDDYIANMSELFSR